MKKKFIIFPDGSIGEVDEADYNAAIEAGAKDYTPPAGKGLYRFKDESFGEVDETDFASATEAGGVPIDFNVKKKEETLPVENPLSFSYLFNGTKAPYAVSGTPEKPVLTEQVRRGLKLNPFFQTPTLDRPDITAVEAEQKLGGEAALTEQGNRIKKFLESPTIEELDDDGKKDVLDLVFAGKETELNITGNLDEAAKRKLTRERNEFSQRFYNAELSGEDIDLIKQANPIALPKQYDTVPSYVIAQGINNKTKKLSEWASGVNEAGAENYVLTRKELEAQKQARQEALDQLVATNYIEKVGDRYITNIPERQYMADQANGLQSQIDDTDLRLSYVNRDFDLALYRPHEKKYHDEKILGRIQQMYAGMKPEDIYKWEGGMQMTEGSSYSPEGMAALKKLHDDPRFKLGDIIKYDETNHLTPESVVKLRELITGMVNADRDPIIEAHEHGEVRRKMRQGVTTGVEAGGIAQDVSQQGSSVEPLPINPEDLIKKTINYFNYELPAKVLAEGYNNKWKKSIVGQQVAPFLDAQEKINSNNAEIAKFESAIKTSLDAGYLSINDKYSKIFEANPEFAATVGTWKKRVDDGLISPEQAEIELMRDVKNNLVLKEILSQKDAEVDRLRNTANAQRERLLIEGGKTNPNLEVDDKGRLTIKGMTREQLDDAIADYQKGYERELINTYKGQEDFLVKRADMINAGMAETFGRFGGAFAVGVTGAVDDLGAATARWLYHKTGMAGDTMNYFEGQKQRPLNIGEYATNHYTYKGFESLMDPAYYGFASGQSFPYAAPALVLGAATGGTTPGIIAASIGGATLETAENALITRNELFMEGVDKDGLKITSTAADRIAAQQFRDELVPNITFQALELGALLRTAKYASPGISLKTAAKGVADVISAGAAEAVQEGIQGYVQAAAKQKGTEGTDLDLFDYLQTDDFVQNFFGGFAGGVTMGGGVKPLAYANSIRNWQGMIRESKDAFANNARNDFANDVPYANALHAEINGTSAEFRDGIRLRLENGQFKDNKEKENLKRAINYSQSLSKSVQVEGIVPENVNELYAAHSVAMADMYESLAESNKETTQGKVYAQQAKASRQQAVDAMNGEAKFYYVLDFQGRPVFMSEKTANVLGESKSLERMKRAGYITEAGAVNDEVFVTNIANVVNGTPAAVSPAPKENPITVRWKDNIRSIGERTDLTDVQKEALKQFEDKRYADELAAEGSTDLFQRTKASAGQMLRNTLDGAEVVGDKAGGLRMMTDQALSAPSGLLGQMNNNEELVTDLIAQNTREAIEAKIKEQNDLLAGEITNDVELKTIDQTVSLLEKGLKKNITNDTQNISGVSGAQREGQESVQAQPDQGAGAQEAGGSGVVQVSPEEKEIIDTAAASGVTLSEEEVDDVAAIVAASQETDTPMTVADAVEFYEREKSNRPVVAEAAIVPGNKFVSELDSTTATIVSAQPDSVTVIFDGQSEPETMSMEDFDELFNPAPSPTDNQVKESMRPVVEIDVKGIPDTEIVKNKDRVLLKNRKDAVKADIGVLNKLIICIYG